MSVLRTPGRPGRRARAARLAAIAGGIAACCTPVPAAQARDRVVGTVVRPFMAQPLLDADETAGAVALTATGNGETAWIVRGADPPGPERASAAVWTLRDGARVHVVDLPLAGGILADAELGVARGGVPVLVVKTWPRGDGPARFTLVDLDDGSVRRQPGTRRGLRVASMAVDDGRLYLLLHPARVGPRNTSSLWRAPVAGTSVGRPTKLRSSRRGETWGAMIADVGRVAITAYGPPEADLGPQFAMREETSFGTPRGPWTRTGVTYETDYGYWPHFLLGFTHDGGSLLIGQPDEGRPSIVERVAMGTKDDAKRPPWIRLGTTTETELAAVSYDASTRRIVAFGPDRSGAPTVGETAVVFGR